MAASNCICKDFHCHYSIVRHYRIWCQSKSYSAAKSLRLCFRGSLGDRKDALLLYSISNLTNNCTVHNCSRFNFHQLAMELHPERTFLQVMNQQEIAVILSVYDYKSLKWAHNDPCFLQWLYSSFDRPCGNVSQWEGSSSPWPHHQVVNYSRGQSFGVWWL